MNLREKTARSVRITFLASIASGSVQAVNLVVLARLLQPTDYGVVAGAMIAISLVQRLLFGNIEGAILLQDDLSRRNWFTILWSQIALASSVTLIFVSSVLAVSATTTFKDVFLFMSPILAMSGISLVARARLRRDMEFGRLVAIDSTSQILGVGAVSISLAACGYGAMSLVAGYVTQAGLQLTLLYLFSGLKIEFEFERATIRAILTTAIKLLGTSSLEVLHMQIAPTVVGAFLGTPALGLYNRSYSLIQLPIELLSTAMSRVLYSSFRVARDELDKLRRGSMALVQIGTAVILPVCFGIAAASQEIVLVALGQKWVPATPLLPWLALGTATFMTAHFLAVLNEAAGRLGAKMAIQAITSAITIGAFLGAAQFGLVSCAMAFAFGSTIFLVGQVEISSGVLEHRRWVLFSWFIPGLLAGVTAAGYIFVVHLTLPKLAPLTLLAIEIPGCALILPAFYRLFFPKLLSEILSLSGVWTWIFGDSAKSR